MSPSPEADMRHFFHGHSYAANPIACAAACASLLDTLFESENTLEHVALLARRLAKLATQLRGDERVREVRACRPHVGAV